MDARTTPIKLDLKRDEKLVVQWQDGHTCVYPIAYLRKHCPCASCKQFREEQATKPRTSLTVFSKTSEGPLSATGAQLVGGYARRVASRCCDASSAGIVTVIACVGTSASEAK